MSNIEQNLQKILTSRYGKDVRQSIHDGIYDCYEDGKVGAVDLVARKRIDNLSKLEPGSTTGDAELRDIRIGYDGTEYENAGEAVRCQIGSLSEDISGIIKKQFSSVSGVFYHKSNVKKGEYYKIKIDIEGSTNEFSVAFRKNETGENNYQKNMFTSINGSLTTDFVLCAEDYYDTLSFYSKNQVNVSILIQIDTEVIQNEYIKKQYEITVDKTLLDKNIELLANKGMHISDNIKPGDTFIMVFSNSIYTGSFKLGIAFRKNEEWNTNHQLMYNIIGDTSIVYTAEDSYDSIYIYDFIGSSFYLNVIKYSKLNLMANDIKKLSTNLGQLSDDVNQISNDVNQKLSKKYKTFSILSDSYSTFEGFTIPETNRQWYPPVEGNQGAGTGNDVMNIEDTWWYLFANEYDCCLIQNNSYSGSPICNDGYGEGNDDAKNTSFVKRVENIGKAELIFVLGATNDSWIGVEMGEYIYSNWTDENLKYFRPALSYVLNYLKQHNMGSKIVFVLNNGLSSNINDSVETICKHYNVGLVKLSNNVTKIENHPDKNGMIAIKNELINFLKVN